mgnify:CR=1 FL=1
MKRAIKINLNGNIFHIDEDAYEALKRYLDDISRHFSNKEEAEEIMNDIESRIAELFHEKIVREEEVIPIKLVKEVIEVMGEPEEIIDPGEGTSGSRKNYYGSGNYKGNPRRLYRDSENTVIAGVAGGLGAYFNIDPLIFRILFVVFIFVGGFSLIVYPILWIALPKAETAAQKLEMRGEPVNVSNIEKKIREEYESTKENIKNAANSETVKKTKKATSNFFSEIGKIFLVFFKIILIIIGTSFVISGVGIIIALFSGTFIGMNVLPFGDYDFTLSDILTPFSDPASITLLIISITLLFLIPVAAMIYGLIRLIFSIKTHNRGLSVGAVTLWFVSLIMTLGILVIETGNFSDSGSSETQSVLSVNEDTLVVSINSLQKREFDDDLELDLDLNTDWYFTEDLDKIYGEINLDIKRSDNGKFELDVVKRSKGKNWDEADYNASSINYNYILRGNKLELDPYFFIESSDKWRFPRVDLILRVPEGKYVRLEKDTKDILDDVYNTDHISDWNMAGKTWEMTESGLTKTTN